MSEAQRYLRVHEVYLPRGKGVHVLRDARAREPNNYCVWLTYNQKTYSAVAGLTKAVAYTIAEAQEMSPGPEGDSTWPAVLARLMGKPAEAGVWQGSGAEYAGRYFVTGSWNWLATLTDFRKRKEASRAT